MNIFDLLFPKKCLECGIGDRYICSDCISQVLDGTFDENNFAVFKYRGVIRKVIVSLKYKFAYDVCDELIEACVNRLKSSKLRNVILVPIPLFWQRENFRGFNQAEILGQKLAEKMRWKFITDLLIRNKNTHPQVGLKGLERHQNLSDAFSVNPDCVLGTKYSVLIFDDVYTTGSTIKEAKKVLEMAGFKNIYSLTIAR
ncbi:MAG: ComF family protein [Microgenomates group bacterium]